MNDELLLKSRTNNDKSLVDSINQLQKSSLLEREDDQKRVVQLEQINISQPWEVLKALYYLFSAKRSNLNLKNNWSVAELDISEAEYQFLYNWVILSSNKPSHGFLKSVLAEAKIMEGKINYRHAFGLVLFVFECEYIRRNGSNEEIWGTLSQTLKDSCCRTLFNSAGQATQEHKNLIKDTVIKFDIRNIFNNLNDTQSWFDTFFLQIGFPQKGIRNLSNWLHDVNLTYALKVLLNSNDLNYSNGFKTLFETLKEIKTLGIIEQDTLRTVTTSPWILPEWVSEIITLILNDNNFHFYNSISTKIRLSYDTKPEFLVEVMFEDENVKEEKVFIECGGIKQCFLRNNQGRYQDLEHSNTFRVPFVESSDVMDIYVYDKRGVLIAEKEFELWGEEDEVILFDTQGKLMDLKDQIRAGKIAYAIMPNDLKVEPTTKFTQGVEFNLYRFDNCNIQKYDVFLDECLIWSSEDILSDHILHNKVKKLIRDLELKADPVHKNKFSLIVPHSSEIIIREVIFEAESIPVQSVTATKTVSEPFIITKRAGDETFKIKIKYKNELETLRKKVIIPKVGVIASYKRKPYIALNHNDHLTLNHLRDSRFKISHQNKLSYNTQDLFYVEGGSILYKYKDRLQKGIKKCIGYGGSLILRSNPINDMDRNDISITRCVFDTGVISDVKLNRRNISINLISSIEPSSDHKVVCLAHSAQFDLIDNITASKDGSWDVEVSDENIACIGIIYKSQIIGQFWLKEHWLVPLESVIKVGNSLDIKKITLFYRCFKAPLLYSDSAIKQRGSLLAIISQNFVDIVSAWLSPNELIKFEEVDLETKPFSDDKDWHKVLSEVFWFFDFNRLDINEIREDLILQLQEEAQIYSREVEQWAGVFMLLSFISPFFFNYMLNNSKDLLEDNYKQIIMLIKHQLECQFKNRIEQVYGQDYIAGDLLKQICNLIADKYYMEETFIKDTIDYAVQINQHIKSKNDIFGSKYYIEEFENSHSDTNRIKLLKNNLRFLLKDSEFRDLLSLKLMERIGILCLN
jgi:hypothetical protein